MGLDLAMATSGILDTKACRGVIIGIRVLNINGYVLSYVNSASNHGNMTLSIACALLCLYSLATQFVSSSTLTMIPHSWSLRCNICVPTWWLVWFRFSRTKATVFPIADHVGTDVSDGRYFVVRGFISHRDRSTPKSIYWICIQNFLRSYRYCESAIHFS